jgi:hypothetical protein
MQLCELLLVEGQRTGAPGLQMVRSPEIRKDPRKKYPKSVILSSKTADVPISYGR